jgi:hypothetical protein
MDEVHVKLYLQGNIAGYILATSVINKDILPISGSTPAPTSAQCAHSHSQYMLVVNQCGIFKYCMTKQVRELVYIDTGTAETISSGRLVVWCGVLV